MYFWIFNFSFPYPPSHFLFYLLISFVFPPTTFLFPFRSCPSLLIPSLYLVSFPLPYFLFYFLVCFFISTFPSETPSFLLWLLISLTVPRFLLSSPITVLLYFLVSFSISFNSLLSFCLLSHCLICSCLPSLSGHTDVCVCVCVVLPSV